MRAIRYFGLDQWDEMREFVIKLSDEKSSPNMAVYASPSYNNYIVEWDEELIDLENK